MKLSIFAIFTCLTAFTTAETIMLKTTFLESTNPTYLCPLFESNNNLYLFQCPHSRNHLYELNQTSGTISLTQQWSHLTTTLDLNIQFTAHDHFPFLSFSTDRSNTFWSIDDQYQLNGELNSASVGFYAAKGVEDGKNHSDSLFAIGASIEELEAYGEESALELQKVTIEVEVV